jgi:formylglycine-generating enzyme required for sulfatase activity
MKTHTNHISRVICGVIMSMGMALPAQEAKPAAGRAEAGENFTNSAGMDMVWIKEGGFWIGRSEVTKDAYKVIMGEGGAGSMPADGISLIKALMFCDALTKQETSSADGKRIMPSAAQDTLPGVKQWQMASQQADTLSLTGFHDSLSEWTKD